MRWPALRLVLSAACLAMGAARMLSAEGSPPSPITASLRQILAEGPDRWQNPSFGLYRWDRFPEILVIDTISGAFQDRMFTRLAYLLEKNGFQGRLMTNMELEGMRGWNAHDYGADGLALFFDRAERTGFPLDPEETLLRSVLAANGLISSRGRGFVPGTGGVLSITRTTGASMRKLFLVHEAFHGLFFASPRYRLACYGIWNEMEPDEHAFFLRLLEALGYGTADLYLVVNEMQAYLLQQPLELTEAYLERVAALLSPEMIPSGGVASLVPLAGRLDRISRDLFGIEAGGASLLAQEGGS